MDGSTKYAVHARNYFMNQHRIEQKFYSEHLGKVCVFSAY